MNSYLFFRLTIIFTLLNAHSIFAFYPIEKKLQRMSLVTDSVMLESNDSRAIEGFITWQGQQQKVTIEKVFREGCRFPSLKIFPVQSKDKSEFRAPLEVKTICNKRRIKKETERLYREFDLYRQYSNKLPFARGAIGLVLKLVDQPTKETALKTFAIAFESMDTLAERLNLNIFQESNNGIIRDKQLLTDLSQKRLMERFLKRKRVKSWKFDYERFADEDRIVYENLWLFRNSIGIVIPVPICFDSARRVRRRILFTRYRKIMRGF